MFRVREALRDQQQSVAPQADPPLAGLGERAAVPHLPEELREHAGPLDARADPQPQPPVSAVREGFLPALAAPGSPQAGGEHSLNHVFTVSCIAFTCSSADIRSNWIKKHTEN
jgi:hypothetical protein